MRYFSREMKYKIQNNGISGTKKNNIWNEKLSVKHKLDIVVVRGIKTNWSSEEKKKTGEKKKASVTYGIIWAVVYVGCKRHRRQSLRSWGRKKIKK